VRALDANVLARLFVDDATFDRRLAKRARALALMPPVELLV
jgi:hypothetical protein